MPTRSASKRAILALLLGAPMALGSACGPSAGSRVGLGPPPGTASPAPDAAPQDAGAPDAADASVEARSVSRAPSAAIGTAGPLVVEAAAADGGWVVFCQARTDTDGDGRLATALEPGGKLGGDRLERYFARGAGEGERIDALAGYDPTGRWVVVERDGKLRLIDTTASTELDLSARGIDARNDVAPYRSHRSLAFDSTGSFFAWVRRAGTDWDVTIRTLATGAEAHVDPGGEPWRIELGHGDPWVQLSTLYDDTNGDKRLTWPAPEAKRPPPCRAHLSPFTAWVERGDKPVTKLGRVSGGKVELVPGFVTALGEARVVREQNHTLVLLENGTRTELASSACQARVLHADAERQLLLVACSGGKTRAALELVGKGTREELKASISGWPRDRQAGAPTRLVAVYPGNDAALVDLETRRLVSLKSGDAVLTTHGARALVRRGKTLVLFDAVSAEERVLDDALTSTEALVNGALVAIAPTVASAERGERLGRLEGRPLALAPDGRVLVAEGGDPDGERLAVGPLVWREPRAPAPATDGGAPDAH